LSADEVTPAVPAGSGGGGGGGGGRQLKRRRAGRRKRRVARDWRVSKLQLQKNERVEDIRAKWELMTVYISRIHCYSKRCLGEIAY
jgi:hypothetical protein